MKWYFETIPLAIVLGVIVGIGALWWTHHQETLPDCADVPHVQGIPQQSCYTVTGAQAQ
ncbi:hypothetical protein N0754_19360 [Pseudomonas aeruginosa]|nr:hypothetical protein [Pseudomonas aeruginosa]MCS9764395.1 hypothetical protein [Pseudomonas aeruginosa]MCS9822435.1 hypothetical protein [Pseudomonas aeruginosa]MCT0241152.1 hypothetical protein [Pseudomonas aeruginosa]MCT0530000.1 hypothetical protein [Pseudomonas aeruginosa]